MLKPSVKVFLGDITSFFQIKEHLIFQIVKHVSSSESKIIKNYKIKSEIVILIF